MRERIAIIDGLRTPFCKAGGVLKEIEADDLAAYALKEIWRRNSFYPEELDEVIVGNAVQPVTAANIARVIALKAGLPKSIPAYTVQRNCASGFEALTTAANKILAGEAEFIAVAATESMSRIPFLASFELKEYLTAWSRTKTLKQKLALLPAFKLKYLQPVIGLQQGLSDPVCGLNMGLTAEILAKEFNISREEQDLYAQKSHQKAAQARAAGKFREEIHPLLAPPHYQTVLEQDDGIKDPCSLERLAALPPYFDRFTGTVTAGNSSQVTDGAVAVLIMRESQAKARGLQPIGYLRDYSYAGLEGSRMGLGPVYSTARLLKKGKYTLKDFSIIEINEAFAAQVLACIQAFASKAFAEKELGLSAPLGEIDLTQLNPNGGAIAIGHPVGASGLRLALTLLKELKRSNKNLGLATLCVGGGQGGSLALELC